MKPTCIILSSLLMAAHCLRASLYPLVALCLLMPLMMMFRTLWPTRLLQVFLALGGVEWIRTLLIIASQRNAENRPWIRMAVILGSVAAFSFLSAWLARPRSPAQNPATEGTR